MTKDGILAEFIKPHFCNIILIEYSFICFDLDQGNSHSLYDFYHKSQSSKMNLLL